jgi:hypothetical protein
MGRGGCCLTETALTKVCLWCLSAPSLKHRVQALPGCVLRGHRSSSHPARHGRPAASLEPCFQIVHSVSADIRPTAKALSAAVIGPPLGAGVQAAPWLGLLSKAVCVLLTVLVGLGLAIHSMKGSVADQHGLKSVVYVR